MSEGYYIINRKLKKECEDFVDFWENKLYPSFIKQLKEYGESVSGELINKEIVEWVPWRGDGLPTSYCPLLDDSYQHCFGSYNEATGQFHFSESREAELFGQRLYDCRTLKELLDSNADLYIASEDGQEISFEDFVSKTKATNMFGPD